jgi:ArsR family transcriptional regulator, virulence genes transcriptional regulator
MDVIELEKNAEKACDLLMAMANTHRLMMLCKLAEGEKSVNALAESIGLSQSALSQHLARLREKGFVSTRRHAQTIYYSIASNEVEAILSTLHRLYCAR